MTSKFTTVLRPWKTLVALPGRRTTMTKCSVAADGEEAVEMRRIIHQS